MLSEAERTAILAGTTTTIPLAGKVLGVGRNAAYKASKSGDLPTIKLAGQRRVLTSKLREMLGLSATYPAAK